MSNLLEQKIDLMKREIDALQIAAHTQAKPWYKNMSTILSTVALLFSFGTTFVSYHRTTIQDIQNTRQELRGLLQRISALPKEVVEINKKYSSDTAAIKTVLGFINQENTLLATQAAELAKKLPTDLVSSAEYYAIAVALQATYDLAGADEFLKYSIQAAKDFNTEIAVVRSMAGLKFLQGQPDAGRIEFQKALDIFSKYPAYDSFTKANTNVFSEVAWAQAEANIGQYELKDQHFKSAMSIVDSLPQTPGANNLRDQIMQAQLRTSTPPPLGASRLQFRIAPSFGVK